MKEHSIATAGVLQSRANLRHEDGNNDPIAAAFDATPGTIWDATLGSATLCPGDSAALAFQISYVEGTPLFFSYASMVLPSNDAFVANGNPLAHPIIGADGSFIPVSVKSLGSMVRDAGTEVNDEIAANTAFFGLGPLETFAPTSSPTEYW